jgi:DNA mismatch endonuclease (patch repair protein)
MAGVRRSGTGAELAVARTLVELGAAYRKNVRDLPGSPDFANKRRRWAVFVHGCFWHHHTGCRRATVPKANREFWLTKFRSNRARDAMAIRALRRKGWRVAIVWECQCGREAARRRLSKVLEARRVDVT